MNTAKALEIFQRALDLADPAERLGYLNGACGADAELLAHVQKLLGSRLGLRSRLGFPVLAPLRAHPATVAMLTVMALLVCTLAATVFGKREPPSATSLPSLVATASPVMTPLGMVQQQVRSATYKVADFVGYEIATDCRTTVSSSLPHVAAALRAYRTARIGTMTLNSLTIRAFTNSSGTVGFAAEHFSCTTPAIRNQIVAMPEVAGSIRLQVYPFPPPGNPLIPAHQRAAYARSSERILREILATLARTPEVSPATTLDSLLDQPGSVQFLMLEATPFENPLGALLDPQGSATGNVGVLWLRERTTGLK